MLNSPLVQAAWLAKNLDNPRLRIVDTRFVLGQANAGREAYLAGHIPGAVFCDLEQDLAAPVRPDRVGGRHPLPNPETLAAKLGGLGIGNTSLVVAYDDPSTGQGFYAAHLWWLLRYLGHNAVAVLNGGLPAWLRQGGTLVTDTPSIQAARFEALPRPEMLASAKDVATRKANTALLDSRAGARYRGETEPLDPVAGHIPGAKNLDWASALGANGEFLDAAAQRTRLRVVTQDSDVMLYCGSGVSACANVLALELAGQPSTLYAGSWSDWISDPTRPIETGEAK